MGKAQQRKKANQKLKLVPSSSHPWAGRSAVNKAIALIRRSTGLYAGSQGDLLVALTNTTYDPQGVETKHGYNEWQMQELTTWIEANQQVFRDFSKVSICLLREDGSELIAVIE